MESIWRYELNTPKLVCYRNIPYASLSLSPKRPILDIDYLVYDVFKRKYPLDLFHLFHIDMTCLFTVTRVSDGRLVLLKPGDDDIYRLFKASLAIPGCYPSAVSLGEDEYVDGGTLDPLPVKVLINQNIDKIFAILSKPIDCESEPPTLLERTLFWRYFHRYDWMLERLWEAAQAYNEQVSLLPSMAQKDPPEALILCQDRMPPVKFITRDKNKINRTIDLGYKKAMIRMDEIKSFLNLSTRSLVKNAERLSSWSRSLRVP